MSITEIEQLRRVLAQHTGTNASDWYLTFKARYGMAAVFAALKRISGGDEKVSRGLPNEERRLIDKSAKVVTQLYTCCTAVDPVIASGLTPRYAEINDDTLTIDPERLTFNDDDVALVLQHTFGIMDRDSDVALAERARAAGVLLVEDNAHCIGRLARDAVGVPLADVSIHSFGVEKMLPTTRFGGAVWVNPSLKERALELDRAMRAELGNLAKPMRRLELATRLYKNEMRVLSRLPGRVAQPIRKALRSVRFFEPAISPDELAGGLEYDNIAVTPWVAAQATRALERLDSNETQRKEIVMIYTNEFANVPGIDVPAAVRAMTSTDDSCGAQPLLLFPIHLRDDATADAARAAARGEGGYAKRWYNEVLFPGVTDPTAYHLPRHLGLAGDLTHRALGLPTDVAPETARRVARAVITAVR